MRAYEAKKLTHLVWKRKMVAGYINDAGTGTWVIDRNRETTHRHAICGAHADKQKG